MYALVGQQIFEGTLLEPAAFPRGEQNFSAMGKFEYFDSVAGALVLALIIMTGVNMSSRFAEGHQIESGTALSVYILVGVIILERIVMKTFLAVFSDNFEMKDKDKVLLQLYKRDLENRQKEEHERRRSIIESNKQTTHFLYQDHNYSKALLVQRDLASEIENKIIMQGWAYWCLHDTDFPGKKLWLEMTDTGYITCWAVQPNPKSWVQTLVRTGVEVIIPAANAKVLKQSSDRMRCVLQAGFLSLVIRADVFNPANASIIFVHKEHVLFMPSPSAVRKWLKAFALVGANVHEDVMVMQLDVQVKKIGWDALIKHQQGFGFNDVMDEEGIPGPVALPAAKRVSESGKPSQFYSRAVASLHGRS